MSVGLGDEAPDFTAETTAGPVKFHDWKGKSWAILFSHLKDFTPVCTTELGALAALKPEFDKRNTKVIGLSVDPLTSHEKWQGDIKDVTGQTVNFPMIADHDRKVSNLYGMIHPNASDTMTVRSVYIVGPDNKVKLTLTYPASTGRNFAELVRVLDSLQLTAGYSVATPADWKQGEDVIIVPRRERRGRQDEIPEGVRREEAVPAGDAAAKQVDRSSVGRSAGGLQLALVFQQVDELAEHHGRRAPHLVPEQIEIGVFDGNAFADPGSTPDSRGVPQVVERDFQDLRDLVWRRNEVRPQVADAHHGMQRKAADDDVHRRELAEHAHR